MVSSYKKPNGANLPPLHESFNTKAAKIRITSEHTIGMLKARFPWLRSIRMQITEDNDTLRRILRFIKATIILHNILVEFRDETLKEWENIEDIDGHPEWECGDDEDTDAQATLGLPTGNQHMRAYLLQMFCDMFLI